MTLIRDINNILQYGKKASSYKFATLLGIFDYIIEHPNEKPVNNFHFIPIAYLAKQFISYYYPLSFFDIYQGSFAENKKLAVFNFIDKFKSEINQDPYKSDRKFNQILNSKEKGIFWINELYEFPDPLPDTLLKLLWIVRSRILEQPLRFLHNVKGEIIRFFGLINNNISFDSPYEAHRNEALKQKKNPSLSWESIMKFDQTSLIIDDLTYREMMRYRFWARDVILKSWFEYSVEGAVTKDKITNIDASFYKLIGYAYLEDYPRNTALINKYRSFYEQIGVNNCIYSEKKFQEGEEYHLDHLLPWSYYRVNKFWNLYPCDPYINTRKSNFLPNWTDDLESKIRNHMRLCLSQKDYPLIANDLYYFYHIIHKNKEINLQHQDNKKIEEELLISLKQDWANLLESIPGQLFEF